MTDKPTGICRICGETKTLTANGRIRSHGPVADRCPGGSDLPREDAPQTPHGVPNPYRAPLSTRQPKPQPSWAGVQPFHDQPDQEVPDDVCGCGEQGGAHEEGCPNADEADAWLAADPDADEADAWLAGTGDDDAPSGSPGRWFPSRFDGDCTECFAHFDAGEEIRATGDGGWQGRECCGEEPEEGAEPQQRPHAPRHKVPIRNGRYVMPHPANPGKAFRGTRVTTFVKLASDHFSLSLWQQRTALVGLTLDDGIREEVLALLEAGVRRGDAPPVTVKKSRDALDKLVDRAKSAAGASLRASLGTALHKWTEEVDAGRRTLDDVPPENLDDIAAYRSRMEAAGITVLPHLIERTTAVPGLGVVGTFDRVFRMPDGKYRVGDVKTGDLKYGQDEIAAQMGIYAHGCNGTGIAQWDGEGNPKEWESWSWVPLTDEHGQPVTVETDRGVVMHLPQGEGQCDLYEVDLTTGWRGAQLCSEVRDWHRVKSTMTIMSVPDPEVPPEPPQRRPGDVLAARLLAQADVPEPVSPRSWEGEISLVSTREQAREQLQEAEAAGMPRSELDHMAAVADAVLSVREPAPRDWRSEVGRALGREEALALWQAARDAGVPKAELDVLTQRARARLAELAAPPEPAWENLFSDVQDREQALDLWRRAKVEGVPEDRLEVLGAIAKAVLVTDRAGARDAYAALARYAAADRLDRSVLAAVMEAMKLRVPA
jgi:hypothetical protein